jgi:hypothetical protein
LRKPERGNAVWAQNAAFVCDDHAASGWKTTILIQAGSRTAIDEGSTPFARFNGRPGAGRCRTLSVCVGRGLDFDGRGADDSRAVLRFARVILVLAVAFGSCMAGLLNGRVLCLGGAASHCAIEDPHADSCCPATHAGRERSEPSEDGRGPAECVDVSANVELVRESAVTLLDLRHGQLPLPPIFSGAFRSAGAPAGRPARVALRGHPPASDPLVFLNDIVLTI